MAVCLSWNILCLFLPVVKRRDHPLGVRGDIQWFKRSFNYNISRVWSQLLKTLLFQLKLPSDYLVLRELREFLI